MGASGAGIGKQVNGWSRQAERGVSTAEGEVKSERKRKKKVELGEAGS